MDEDTLYEEKRMKELDCVEAFFIWYYGISKRFRAWRNYKMGDKYIIELSNNDNICEMKLEIPRKFYDIINNYVTSRDVETIDMWDMLAHYTQKIDEMEEK